MKKGLIFLLIIMRHFAYGQPLVKQVFIDGQGPTIVLLHGGIYDHTAYAPHARLLSDSFTVIRMLQFNVQAAMEGWRLRNDYTVGTESEGLKASLDSLGIQHPVTLVGHSYGALIAFDFAINFPERIHALVLVEPPLFDIAKTNGKYSDKMQEIVELTKSFTPNATITEELLRKFRCKFTNCDSFDIRSHPMWPSWLKNKERLRGLSAVSAYQIDHEKFQNFTQPVLVITGTNTIEPHITVDNLLSLEFANAQRGSLTGDHGAIYQNPAHFIRLLKSFLRSHF